MASMLKTPPLQTATATIDTLCGRLQSATLLEDRRAAILGLRSFAKQYPASVASGSLRELIATLKRDGLGDEGPNKSQNGESRQSQEGTGDVDTIRLVLETLLMLFNPDANSPEAGDEIALFLADEFSMRQDNIVLLLNLLDPTSPYADYYSRLYSVQILSAICTARPDRLQECILSAPLGVSRLVGVLDDGRDAVRNAGLLLLVDLTSGAYEELRKIVAFEDVYGKVFALIQLEGGLAEAGITAQDCLSLLANLIRGSASNQTMFRESGCVAQMVNLLQQAFPSDDEAPYSASAREKAAWGLLQLLRLFLVPGEASTPQNQIAFFRAGIAQVLIDLGFSSTLPPPIKASALRAAAALIDSNPPLQEQFAPLTVVTPADAEHNAAEEKKHAQTNGTVPASRGKKSARTSVENKRSYIVEALLDLALDQRDADASLRAAACGLVQAYLTNHDRVKAHFLQRAIGGHAEGETTANVLVTLLHPPENNVTGIVHASWIVQGLIEENEDAKKAFTEVQEGNQEEGEDVVTSIQALGTNLQASLQAPVDERMAAAYASLLTTLLWDFASGVDDLLAEGSSLVQTLLATVKAPTEPVATGLAAVLLGVIYEFSTKDSPISRRTLAPLLQQKLGRTKYLDALLQLRRQPAIRDFDLDQEADEGGDGMLSNVFVDLFTVEYTRLRRAIDKDPGVEVLPSSAAEAGVDRDVLDDLRQQAQAAKDVLAKAQQEALEASQKSEQDRISIGKELQAATTEVERLRKINQAMQQGHENELEKLSKQHEQEKSTIQTRNQHAINNAKQEAERASQATLRERDATSAQKVQELERRIAELGNEHRKESTGHANAKKQLESTTTKLNELIKRERDLSKELDGLRQQQSSTEKKLQAAQDQAKTADAKLDGARKSLDARFEEVNKLKAHVSELQKDLQSRDEELKAERAGFSDLEKEYERTKTSLQQVEADHAKELSAQNKAAEDAIRKAAEAEKKLSEIEARLSTAEAAAFEANTKVASHEQKLKEAVQKAVDSERKAKDAERKIAASEEESKIAVDNLAASEKKLKDAGGKLAAAEKSAKVNEDKAAKAGKDAKDANDKISAAEKKAKDAEEKVAAAEKKAKDANEKASNAQKKVKERDADGKLGETEKKLSDAEAKATAAEEKLKEAVTRAVAAEKKAKEAEEKSAAAEKKATDGSKAASKATGANKEDKDRISKLEKDLEEAKKAQGKTNKAESEKTKKLESELKQIKESEKKAQDEVARLKALEAELKAARDVEQKAKSDLERLRSLESDLESSRDAEAKATAEVEKLKSSASKLEKVRTELRKAQNAEDSAKSELEELKEYSEKLEKAQRELKEVKESEKTAKEELESMLLVMGDIESKRDEYKARIKELGGDVSEEEDDSEDEDEDGEEDDNDVD